MSLSRDSHSWPSFAYPSSGLPRKSFRCWDINVGQNHIKSVYVAQQWISGAKSCGNCEAHVDGSSIRRGDHNLHFGNVTLFLIVTCRSIQPSVQFETNLALRSYALNRPKKLNALDESMIALLRQQVEVKIYCRTIQSYRLNFYTLGMESISTDRNGGWYRNWSCLLRWRRCCQ